MTSIGVALSTSRKYSLISIPAEYGIARAGQNKHRTTVVDLERVEDSDHLPIESGAHRVLLLRSIERDPRDPVLKFHDDIVGAGKRRGSLSLGLLGRRS